MKIAFVKQDVYQDLYVINKDAGPAEILFSSIMRTGPIGFFTEFDTDFYIIKESFEPDCQVWQEILPYQPEILRKLKDKPFGESDLPVARFCIPGNDKPHSDYSINYKDIDWSGYDVVISINCAIPSIEIQKYPDVLWCYMIGEANKYSDKVYFGYDVCFNQETRGNIAIRSGVIDFPYTFVARDTLYDLIFSEVRRNPHNTGIYAEINTTTERPVERVKHLEPLENTGHKVILHHQNLKENLIRMYDSKYMVKVGGRRIRGNSVIEAISLGTLVLMDPNDLIHTQLLPKDCWVSTVEEVIDKIEYLDDHPNEYEKLLTRQKELLQHFVFDCPVKSIKNALNYKKQRRSFIVETRSTGKTKPQILKYYLKKYSHKIFGR